jgi:hypothetical protein
MRHFKTIDWSVSLSLLLACVLTVISGCVESSGPLGAPNVVTDVRTISAVQITLAKSTLAPGQTTQATVVATSADGKVVGVGRIDFSSQVPSIATVSSKGVVTAIAAGTVVIQATASGVGGTAALTVQSLTAPVSAVAAVAVAFDSTKISVGHVAQASAVVKDTAGKPISGQTVTWSSVTPNIASVSSLGAVTAITAGTASIRATASGIDGTASITVEPPPVAAVIVTVDSATLSIGHTAQAFATAKDSAGHIVTGQPVMWTSLSPGIASISSSGKITALAVGVAVIQATISGCSGSTGVTVVASSSVAAAASVAVTVDSTTLLVGHVAQAVATAKDASGNPIAGQQTTWTSLTPGMASVSSSGAVMALAAGPAIIQASISGITGLDTLVVVIPPDLAFANFNDGTIGPYYTYPQTQAPLDLAFPADPTGSGRGNVARIHYVGANGDANRQVGYLHPVHFGETLYFKGDFYFPVGTDLSKSMIQRKLLYWQPHFDYAKYGGQGGPVYWNIISMFGDQLTWTAGMVAQASPVGDQSPTVYGLATIVAGRWYTLEQRMTTESSIGARDGVIQIWLDGVLIFTRTGMWWSDPAWIGQPVPGGNGTLFDAADLYFQQFFTGDQTDWETGSFDEYRYWDNVAFSTTRIGH